MNDKNQKISTPIFYSPYILFFLAGVLYFYWFTNYIFFYQEKAELFQTTFTFFSEKINQPGGFLNYFDYFQTTFYYYPLLGAVLVILEIIAVMVLVFAIGRRISGNAIFLLPFLLGGALFYLQTHYQYRSINTIGILIQLIFFFVTLRIFKGKLEWIPVILFPVNYYLFGSFSFLFLAMFVVWLIQNRPKYWYYKLTGILVFEGVFFYVAQEFLFFQTINNLIVFPYSPAKTGEQVPLFFTVIILVSLLPALFLIKPKIIEKLRIKKIPYLQFIPLLLIIVLAGLSVGRIDNKNSHYFYVEKLFYQQKFDEIIAFNQEFPSNNILTNYLNNIALAETGQLGDRLFSFPQSADGSSLFLKWDLITEVLRRGGYFYYAIGMINEAQRWAYEYMVMRGLTPEGLKMLIKTELINGNYNVAQKYISILKNTLFYKDEATKYEHLLFNESAVKNNPELGIKKALKARQDFFVLSDEPAANLDMIIEADSANFAALQYKLAFLLLEKDMKGIVQLLPVLKHCEVQKVPRNVEEAVIAYQQLKLGEIPNLGQLSLKAETIQRFRQYYQIFQQNSSNKARARRALARDFGNTFWYYVFFS